MLHSLGTSVLFGIVGILLAIVGYKLFDLVETKIDFADEVRKGNTAVAILVGAFILGICFIVGKAVGS